VAFVARLYTVVFALALPRCSANFGILRPEPRPGALPFFAWLLLAHPSRAGTLPPGQACGIPCRTMIGRVDGCPALVWRA
jgi:hypothetical protein